MNESMALQDGLSLADRLSQRRVVFRSGVLLVGLPARTLVIYWPVDMDVGHTVRFDARSQQIQNMMMRGCGRQVAS